VPQLEYVQEVHVEAVIVYSAEATKLGLLLRAVARHFIVCVEETVIADVVLGVAVTVGVSPFVVHLITAPAVVELIVTCCAELYVFATGLNVGVAVLRRVPPACPYAKRGAPSAARISARRIRCSDTQ
jgi:hypothetical protein